MTIILIATPSLVLKILIQALSNRLDQFLHWHTLSWLRCQDLSVDKYLGGSLSKLRAAVQEASMVPPLPRKNANLSIDLLR